MPSLLRLIFFLGLTNLLLAAEPLLTITASGQRLAFTTAEFAALPHTACTTADPHTKAELKFSGVSVRDLLARAGAPLGAAMRGPALQQAVLIRATDGYAVIFSLAEFDESFGNRTILLADQESGAALSERHGPLRLVVSGDQKAARWIRQVKSIELLTVGEVAPRPPAKPAH